MASHTHLLISNTNVFTVLQKQNNWPFNAFRGIVYLKTGVTDNVQEYYEFGTL